MLGDFYLTVDSVAIPNPVSFSYDYENLETTTKSEAGTDLVSVTRLMKLSCSMSFQVSSIWKEKLEEMCKKNQSTLSVNGSTGKTGRLRISKAELYENSENVSGTDGLWTLSIDFTEV